MSVVIAIVQRTPIWVFPLIAAVLWLGAANLRQRTILLRSSLVLPLVMLTLSVGNLIATRAPSAPALLAWLGCTIIGIGLGWSITRRPIAVDPAGRTITLDGSAVPLLVSAGIVVLRYVFGYLYGRHPELVADPTYALTLIGGGALLSGVTFGRTGRIARSYWRDGATSNT